MTFQPKAGARVGKRGKGLQTLIDYSNRQYMTRGIADVREVPVPFQITGAGKRPGEMTGRTKKGEWVDYVGICDGRTIAFDAKETGVDRLPFDSLHEHQYELLKSWHEKGGCTFLIVAFTNKFQEIYLLPFQDLGVFWENAKAGGRKSIPYSYFFENCEIVKPGRGIVLDYLDAIKRKDCHK